MNSNYVTSAIVIGRSLPMIVKGFELLKKQNKTEEEELAARGFKKAIITAVSLGLITAVILGVFTLNLVLNMASGDKIYGKVEGSNVQYIMNSVQHVPLDEVGLSSFNLSEGDRVLLLLHGVDGTIMEAFSLTDYNEKQNRSAIMLIIALVGCVVVCVVGSKVIHKTIGKHFYVWYKKQAV